MSWALRCLESPVMLGGKNQMTVGAPHPFKLRLQTAECGWEAVQRVLGVRPALPLAPCDLGRVANPA